MAQHQRHLSPIRRLAGTENDGDRLAGYCLVDVDWQKAAAIVVRIKERQLLAAVNPVLGVVDVEQDAPGYLLEAVAEQLDHRRHHAFERGRARQVLEPADRRLRAQIFTAFRQSSDCHLEGRIGAERIAVVAVGVACRDQQRAIADHFGQPVHHPFRVAPVFEAGGQALGDLQALLERGQQHNAGIRTQPSAVKTDMHRLASNGWQTR